MWHLWLGLRAGLSFPCPRFGIHSHPILYSEMRRVRESCREFLISREPARSPEFPSGSTFTHMYSRSSDVEQSSGLMIAHRARFSQPTTRTTADFEALVVMPRSLPAQELAGHVSTTRWEQTSFKLLAERSEKTTVTPPLPVGGKDKGTGGRVGKARAVYSVIKWWQIPTKGAKAPFHVLRS